MLLIPSSQGGFADEIREPGSSAQKRYLPTAAQSWQGPGYFRARVPWSRERRAPAQEGLEALRAPSAKLSLAPVTRPGTSVNHLFSASCVPGALLGPLK